MALYNEYCMPFSHLHCDKFQTDTIMEKQAKFDALIFANSLYITLAIRLHKVNPCLFQNVIWILVSGVILSGPKKLQIISG